MNKATVYTDGSSTRDSGTKGNGAAAAIILQDTVTIITRRFPRVGNNQMELYAVWLSLQVIPAHTEVHIITDSKNVINWLNKTFARKDTFIKEFADSIDQICKQKNIILTFTHVKGHSGNIYNEQADKLARYTKITGKELFYTMPL